MACLGAAQVPHTIIVYTDTCPLYSTQAPDRGGSQYLDAQLNRYLELRDGGYGADFKPGKYSGVWGMDSNRFYLAGIRDSSGVKKLGAPKAFTTNKQGWVFADWVTGDFDFYFGSTAKDQRKKAREWGIRVSNGIVTTFVWPGAREGRAIKRVSPGRNLRGPTQKEMDELEVR